MPLSRTTALKLMNHLNGKSVFVVTNPLKLQLVGEYGALTIPAPVNITLSTAVDLNDATRPLAESENSASVRYYTFPSQMDIHGWQIIDSSSTPQVLWYGDFTRIRTVPSGDDFEVPIGELDLELSKEV